MIIRILHKSSLLLLLAGLYLAMAHGVSAQVLTYGLEQKQLEKRVRDNFDRNAWSTRFKIGYDEWKIQLRSNGNYDTISKLYKRFEHQALLQVMISEFFDVKAGVRVDTPDGADRNYAVLGIEGLAKQWIETDFSLYYSEKQITVGLADFDYELLITQNIIFRPNLEVHFASADDAEVGIYEGLRRTEIGLRLHYEYSRMFSPYIGHIHEWSLGKTADSKDRAGEPIEEAVWLAGLSFSL